MCIRDRDKAYELKERLTKAGFAVKVDDTDKSPGWKFADCEMRGVPLRVEIGPKDIEKNQAVLVRRDNPVSYTHLLVRHSPPAAPALRWTPLLLLSWAARP